MLLSVNARKFKQCISDNNKRQHEKPQATQAINLFSFQYGGQSESIHMRPTLGNLKYFYFFNEIEFLE